MVHGLEIAMPPCAAVRTNEKSSPATPSRPTPSSEKVAQRVNYECQQALILQLSLLVDQEFGGLSFPVAGFGDGLMEPAPERPSENEVDAELSWKRAMRRRISGMLKAMNAADLPPPFGRQG